MVSKKLFSSLTIIVSMILSAALITLAQSKEVALTIDDLPLNGPAIDVKRMRRMTENLLTVIKTNRLPMVGFVNEGLLYVSGETDARIEILKLWQESGVELGNHTYSHLGFKDASLADFEDDFVRGDALTKLLVRPNKPRYFRHPFLQMGATREIEEAFENFIKARGYQSVPVTMDTMDWMYLAAYAKSLKEKDKSLQKQVTEEYLNFVGQKIDAAEQNSQALFGRNIKHILLLHANELNGDNFAEVIKVFRRKGYRFITVEEALKDEVYRFPDNYAPVSDWLAHWAVSKGKKIENPQPSRMIRSVYEGRP